MPSEVPANPIEPLDQYTQSVPQPLAPPHGRLSVQLTLLALTLVTTTLAGVAHHQFFKIDLALIDQPEQLQQALTNSATGAGFYLSGLWYSLTILLILGCHEMGHYVACLRYGVLATRPYFLPVPLPLTGTFGAFIRIKSRIPTKTALFDIGIAGPLAGFIIAVPALVIGLMLSRIDRLPQDQSMLVELGEPLLFKLVAWLVWGPVPSGYSVNMHPMAFAAWFGLLATALNLFPIAQLDGGHISYAVLGRRSTYVTFIMIGVAIILCFRSSSWIVWTLLLLVMIGLLGPHHPPTLDDEPPIDRGRVVMAAAAMIILALCFTPVPIGEILTGR